MKISLGLIFSLSVSLFAKAGDHGGGPRIEPRMERFECHLVTESTWIGPGKVLVDVEIFLRSEGLLSVFWIEYRFANPVTTDEYESRGAFATWQVRSTGFFDSSGLSGHKFSTLHFLAPAEIQSMTGWATKQTDGLQLRLDIVSSTGLSNEILNCKKGS